MVLWYGIVERIHDPADADSGVWTMVLAPRQPSHVRGPMMREWAPGWAAPAVPAGCPAT